MAYVKTELISRNGVLNHIPDLSARFDIFHGLCQNRADKSWNGVLNHIPDAISSVDIFHGLCQTELISLEWGFKHIPDLSALF